MSFEDNPIYEQLENDILQEEKKKKGLSPQGRKDFIHGVIVLFLVIIGSQLFFSKVMNFSYTKTRSMAPTIEVGDKISDIYICNKLAYFKATPKRGDIIVFSEKDNDKYLCKRVVGLPGDTVSFEDGYVYINNKQLDESAYLSEDVETNCIESFKVPKGKYFVMGDNREDSLDSRFFKDPYVDKNEIVSKVIFILPTHSL